ncbi:hypothetical protein E1B28_000408 [Marasmius oreades]|uniref:Muskelin N-terminal domain-containing protein n=1 Tax=Marasmius oreades TaxID=181124 RepID=A0A9P7V1D5_9AGAR|nr:uncharacterized protein E1B28_000408 [Marasmius oreades]KAG7098462.1 hypothetical protein E1B28_000408 [Marasmius oreades]
MFVFYSPIDFRASLDRQFIAHPCNMKDFKVYLGLAREQMVEVLHGSLKNDNIPETFSLKYVDDSGLCFPTLYVKIVPLSAHGASFNSSIWYISMTGIADEAVIQRVKQVYDQYQETQALRHLLKHLRQRRLLTPYQSILERAGVEVEHPLVSKLHSSTVLHGDWTNAERVLHELSDTGLFESHLQSHQSRAIWKRIHGGGGDNVPSPRGGHAMCIDHRNSLIYLFGGFDGRQCLDDLWVYDICKRTWRSLDESTSSQLEAPGPRSCHKMVHDPTSNSLYVLGKLPESDELKTRQNGNTPASRDRIAPSRTSASEFYRYDVEGRTWEQLTDPAGVGGPSLLFDHQMAIDGDRRIIYVSGGRVGDGEGWSNTKYSGMYSYSLQHKKWLLLQHLETGVHSTVVIPPRFGHSMVLDPTTQTLFLFAGQHGDNFLSDLYSYDINTSTAKELSSNITACGGPEPSFSQRAVINPKAQEIYVFNGLTRAPTSGSLTFLPPNSPCWVYRYRDRPGKWLRVLHGPTGSPINDDEIPVSRFAQEVVYDPTTSSIYFHGGNTGTSGPLGKAFEKDNEKEVTGSEERLGDFWEMKLQRSSSSDVIRRATFLIRQQRFKEMCEESPAVRALAFLQNEVSSVVNHHDPEEAESFRTLLTHLLSSHSMPGSPPLHEVPERSGETLPPRKRTRPNTPEQSPVRLSRTEAGGATTGTSSSRSAGKNVAERMLETKDPLEPATDASSEQRFQQRNEVFEKILHFIDQDEKQPTSNLLDLFGINLSPC